MVFRLFNSNNNLKTSLSVTGVILTMLAVSSHFNRRNSFKPFSNYNENSASYSNIFSHRVNTFFKPLPVKTWNKSANILDGCYHVYLDVGSNIGVQVRKLYEPQLFLDAPVHKIFAQFFGPFEKRSKIERSMKPGDSYVCSVGFEPNSHHTQYLKEIVKNYQKCHGWNVHFFTESGVSNKNGVTKFFSDNSHANFEWGGGILPPEIMQTSKKTDGNKYKNVTLIRLSEFVNQVVANRRLPQLPNLAHLADKGQLADIPPRVAMKMDIEGSEVDVVPDLIFSGSLQYVNIMMVEWHPHFERNPIRKGISQNLNKVMEMLDKYVQSLRPEARTVDFKILNFDDEKYHNLKPELTNC